MNRFRPQDISRRYVIKQRLRTGRADNLNWQSRVKWYPAGWKINHQTLGNIHSRLHYLACHAPEPVQQRWRPAYRVFMNRHFGDAGRASMRYLNTRSCHAWL